MGLAGVFDDDEVMFVGNVADGLHVAGLAIEMNGHDSFGFCCNGGFNETGVEVECCLIYINKNRYGTSHGDGVGGGDE